MYKIKRGDKVIILAGRDKGKKGVVLKIIRSEVRHGSKVCKVAKAVVEGINLVKKHKKADPSKRVAGSVIEKEMPIDISNVALLNPSTDKASKVGFKFILHDNKQKKVRYFKSNQEVVVDV